MAVMAKIKGDWQCMTTNAFGARLRQARDRLHLSMDTVIGDLNDAGVKVSKASLSAYERGTRRPMPDMIRILAKYYETDERELFAAASGFDALPIAQPYAAPVYPAVRMADKKIQYDKSTGDRIVDMQFLGDSPKENLFWVIADDDSMAAAGIPHGAYALIDRTDNAAQQSQDAIMLAAVDDKPATLCRVKRVGRKAIALLFANQAVEPLFVEPRRVNILGRVRLVQIDFG